LVDLCGSTKKIAQAVGIWTGAGGFAKNVDSDAVAVLIVCGPDLRIAL
jgi:hypothetical protein